MNNKISACIFDLDGVIVDTAKYHYKAWRTLAQSLGFDFSEEQNESLKGVGRLDSLNIILKIGGIEKSDDIKADLANEKNENYLKLIAQMDESEILPGVKDFLLLLKKAGIKIALGSASKNALTILNKVGLADLFDVIVDGTHTTKGKPDPQVFLLGAQKLNVQPKECIVFEDAPKGVEAALAANMYCVGVGSVDNLGKAHLVIKDFKNQNLDLFIKL